MIRSFFRAGRRMRLAGVTRALTAGVSLTIAMTGCDRGGGSAATAPPPPEVNVITVATETVPIVYEFIGQTAASNTVEIRARIQGVMTKRLFSEGEKVGEGQELFRIDDRQFRADLDIAKAQLDQAKAQRDRASRQVDRLKELVAQNAASVKELDDWQTQLAESMASVNLREAEVAKAQLELSYTSIDSPINGMIGRSMRDEGSLVDPGANSLLAEVVQTEPIYVEFSISEREWLRWRAAVDAGAIVLSDWKDAADRSKVKARAEAVMLDGTSYEKYGSLDFVDVRVSPETGTALARATFENTPDRFNPKQFALKPGQFVKIRMLGWEKPDTIVVPQRAVIQTPTGQFVYVVGPGDAAEFRPVTLSSWHLEGWLVDKGLKPGERVIVDGLMKVQPGMTVRPTPVAIKAGETPAPPAVGAAPTSGTPDSK
jgi:membrane fusion protein, multidrug efflux system